MLPFKDSLSFLYHLWRANVISFTLLLRIYIAWNFSVIAIISSWLLISWLLIWILHIWLTSLLSNPMTSSINILLFFCCCFYRNLFCKILSVINYICLGLSIYLLHLIFLFILFFCLFIYLFIHSFIYSCIFFAHIYILFKIHSSSLWSFIFIPILDWFITILINLFLHVSTYYFFRSQQLSLFVDIDSYTSLSQLFASKFMSAHFYYF